MTMMRARRAVVVGILWLERYPLLYGSHGLGRVYTISFRLICVYDHLIEDIVRFSVLFFSS